MVFTSSLFLSLMLITICLSITTVSAANQTIGPSDASGIDGAISTAGSGDTVFLNPGTYDKQGSDVGITITKNITIQGNGAKDTVIIDARGNGRIFSISLGVNITFINLTFKNANVISNGSAIYNVYSTTTMTFINCTFINNTASNGGAIYNSGSNLNIHDSNFTNNIATNNGGAIYNSGFNLNIHDSNFTNNIATNNGGAIWNSGSNSTINSSNFTNNSADIGGGAIVNTGSNVNISNSSFNKNKAANYGGAVDNRAGNVTLSESNFTDNTANTGGGIYNLGYMNLTKNKMNNNNATLGKVIYNGNTIYVLNLTFINNATVNVTLGDTITLFINLTDDMGNPITGGNVSFYLNGVFIGSRAVDEGKANLTYTVTTQGVVVVPVNGSYDGSGTYPINLHQGQLRINKIYTNSTINIPSNSKVGNPINITGKLTDMDGNPIPNTDFTLIIGGQTFSLTTDNDGGWIVSFIPSISGNTSVIVHWGGNGTYNNFTNFSSFIVSKLVSNSTITSHNIKVGHNTTISGVAKDEYGNVLANVVLQVSVNGRLFNVTTDIYGAWNLSYISDVAGNLSVNVSWNGNSSLNGFNNKTTFNVSKINSNVVIDHISNVKLDGNRDKLINITGTLRDEYGNLLTNIKLKIVIGNKTYTVITNSTGAWIVRYEVTNLGKIDVKVYFEGNGTYMSSNNSTSFNVSVVPEDIPIIVPKTNNNTNNTNNSLINKINNNINNHLITKAEMKKTGIPILYIFLVLLASLGLLIRKR